LCRALPLLDDTTASEPSMIMGPYIALWPQADIRGGDDIAIIMPDPNGQSAIFQPAGDDFGSAVRRSKRGLALS
jgi:hypothetical protein